MSVRNLDRVKSAEATILSVINCFLYVAMIHGSSYGGSPSCEEGGAPPPKQIFILSGQSNMSGRGGVKDNKWDGVVPQDCRPHPSTLRLTAGCSWEEAGDPLHAGIDTAETCGVGAGMPFANAVRVRLSCPATAIIGLVPCAEGGTAISLWAKGSRLYDRMVRRAAAAAADGGEIRAVLWYQGESDTYSDQAAHQYRANMERLIQDVRSDLNSPSLPFIQVAIASGVQPGMDEVRAGQLGIDLPNVVCVDAKGLALNDDHLHLTTEAQVLLGNMLAEAYINQFMEPPSP